MRSPLRARSARSAVLAVPVAVVGLALATAGPGLGFANDDNGSTRGVQTGKPAPAGTGLVPATTNMQPKPGVKPSLTVPKGSTADMAPSGNLITGHQGTTVGDLDKSDRGAKNLPATKDLGH